ncbi:MAG: DUF1059 domain-containing protein [Chloroflexota bacterium]|jgi:predicted small metal-binding protein|nr:DUF1059 domain-containing protein [Chloroflexota bacterium]
MDDHNTERRLRCACGWETAGTLDEIETATVEHGRRMHNMTPSRDEVAAMLLPADEPSAT